MLQEMDLSELGSERQNVPPFMLNPRSRPGMVKNDSENLQDSSSLRKIQDKCCPNTSDVLHPYAITRTGDAIKVASPVCAAHPEHKAISPILP
jgi:hypothetical protein